MNEPGPFEAFRKSPTPEALLRLLTAHQDAIFTVCLQVLRHRQDAEDAAQTVLLKLASGAHTVREPRAFKSWLYRISFRTAVDLRRQRDSRRRIQEGSPTMDKSVAPALLNALNDAMANLPDPDRLLLAEYYFEKATLQELGRREGLSEVAIWKRIEKSRERLRQGLAGTGFLLGYSQVAVALESVTPAAAPTELISSSILSKAALVAAGGVTVGAKSTLSATTLVAILIALVIGAGGGYFARSIRSVAGNETRPVLPGPTATQGEVAHDDPAGTVPEVPLPAVDSEPRAPDVNRNSASARLARFKNWHRDWSAEKWKTQSEYAEHLRPLIEQGSELRQILLKHVDALLAFAQEPENAACLSSLFRAALHSWVFQQNGHWAITGRSFTDADVPSTLIQGLIENLGNGSEAQRLALIDFGGAFNKPPEELVAEYRKYLQESTGQVLMKSTYALRRADLIASEDLQVMMRHAESSPDVGVRSESLKAVLSARTPAAIDWFFGQLVAQPDSRTTHLAAAAIREGLHMHHPFPRDVEPKAAEAIVGALARGVDDYAHGSFVYAGLCLSGDHAQRVLEAAASSAPSEALRQKTERILESFRSGERNAARLWSEYSKSK